MKNSLDYLKFAESEEEVKHNFANFFELRLDTRNHIDLYSLQVTFEFKFDVDLHNIKILAKCFAQALYYIRDCKYGIRNETRLQR